MSSHEQRNLARAEASVPRWLAQSPRASLPSHLQQSQAPAQTQQPNARPPARAEHAAAAQLVAGLSRSPHPRPGACLPAALARARAGRPSATFRRRVWEVRRQHEPHSEGPANERRRVCAERAQVQVSGSREHGRLAQTRAQAASLMA